MKNTLAPLVVSALALAGFTAFAQTPAPAPRPARPDCSAPEHHQFDFWAGSWTVYDQSGEVAGKNRIEPVLKGCVLLENWTGNGGMSGKSLNGYDRRAKVWRQTWIDDTGGVLLLSGGSRDGKMVMSGNAPGRDGATVTNRIAWERLGDGSVRQLWDMSRDGGKTWAIVFDGVYKKDAVKGSVP